MESTKLGSNLSAKWSYISTLGVIILHVVWFITAQLIGKAYPVFESNVFRFIAQTAICALLAVPGRHSFTFRTKSDFTLLTISSLTYSSFILSMYMAALYLPLGNLDGVFFGTYILLNVITAIAKRRVSLTVILSAVLAIAGVLCIVQPDFMFPGSEALDSDVIECPCTNLSYIPKTESALERHVSRETYRSTMDNCSNMIASSTSNQKLKTNQGLSGEINGYIFAITAGISFGICNQITSAYLVQHYHYAVTSFWNGIVGIIVSLILMASFETPGFNTVPLCILFLVIHCLAGSCILVCCNIAWINVPPEEFSILETLAVVLLLIAQSTFMRRFHPPHGNWEEIFGIVLVLCGCVLDPVYMLGKRLKKKQGDGERDRLLSG